MPLLKASASDYTTVVKALANAGAAVSNPQGSRPSSKGAVPFVNTSFASSLIRLSSFLTVGPTRNPIPAFIPPVVNPLPNTLPNWRAFLIKYNSDGIPLWARRISGTSIEEGNSVTTDSSGNIIMIGLYSTGTVTIFAANGTTAFATFPNIVAKDGLLVKYNSDGTPQWARRMAGNSNDDPLSVITDLSGNIVMCGSYNSSTLNIYAADGTTVFTTLANDGSQDAFITKYNSDGTPLWARRLGGTGNEPCRSVNTDSSGNIIVCGPYRSNPMNIYAADGTTVFTTLANAGSDDAFIVKYSSDGTPQWATRLSSAASDVANSVSTDSSGNIVVVGYYGNQILTIFNTNGTTFSTLTSAGPQNGFITKYNSDGTPQWATRLAMIGDYGSINTSTMDSSGNIIVGGYYGNQILTIFNTNGTTFSTFQSDGYYYNGFVVKCDSLGTPQWARRLGGGNSPVYVLSVSTDSSGNIVVTGTYQSNPLNIYAADGTTVFTTLANAGSDDAFIVKYSSDGTLVWAKRLGGTGSDIIRSVRIDSSGNIVVTGLHASNPLTIT